MKENGKKPRRRSLGARLDRVTQRDAGRVLGVDAATLGRWVACPRNEDHSYNLPVVVGWHRSRELERVLSSQPTAGTSGALERLRTANAQRAELELGIRAGQLVDRAAMEAAWMQTLTRLRQMLLGLPNGLATRLEGRTAREASAVLDARLREMLEEFVAAPE